MSTLLLALISLLALLLTAGLLLAEGLDAIQTVTQNLS